MLRGEKRKAELVNRYRLLVIGTACWSSMCMVPGPPPRRRNFNIEGKLRCGDVEADRWLL